MKGRNPMKTMRFILLGIVAVLAGVIRAAVRSLAPIGLCLTMCPPAVIAQENLGGALSSLELINGAEKSVCKAYLSRFRYAESLDERLLGPEWAATEPDLGTRVYTPGDRQWQLLRKIEEYVWERDAN